MHKQPVSDGLPGVCDSLHSQTENLIAGETHIEIDARAVCRSNDRDRCAQQLKFIKLLAFGAFAVGLSALIATCTGRLVRQPLLAADKTVGFSAAHTVHKGKEMESNCKKG